MSLSWARRAAVAAEIPVELVTDPATWPPLLTSWHRQTSSCIQIRAAGEEPVMRTKTPPNLADVLATDPNLARLSLGLRRTGLLFELVRAPAFTVIAPLDEAFDCLPFPFVDLIHSADLVEERFALFEHLVALGEPGALGHPLLHTVGGGELHLDADRIHDGGACAAHVLGIDLVRNGRLIRTRELPMPPRAARAA